jgi:hypothetical protein
MKYIPYKESFLIDDGFMLEITYYSHDSLKYPITSKESKVINEILEDINLGKPYEIAQFLSASGDRVIHSFKDKPACRKISIKTGKTLAEYWYNHGLLHRERDLPAYVNYYGDSVWYKNNKIHRVKGPAVDSDHYGALWYWEGYQILEKQKAKDFFNFFGISIGFLKSLDLKEVFPYSSFLDDPDRVFYLSYLKGLEKTKNSDSSLFFLAKTEGYIPYKTM